MNMRISRWIRLSCGRLFGILERSSGLFFNVVVDCPYTAINIPCQGYCCPQVDLDELSRCQPWLSGSVSVSISVSVSVSAKLLCP